MGFTLISPELLLLVILLTLCIIIVIFHRATETLAVPVGKFGECTAPDGMEAVISYNLLMTLMTRIITLLIRSSLDTGQPVPGF